MERKSSSKLVKMCIAAMFAALICVATMIIRIPSPLGGYINFGDTFILLAAWIMGPVYGFAAGGIGSALADLFAGYAAYMPGTLIIKGLMAVVGAVILYRLPKKDGHPARISRIFAAVVAEILMIAGYYIYGAVAIGEGLVVALQSVPGNALQGAIGVVGGVVIMEVLEKTKVISKINLKCI